MELPNVGENCAVEGCGHLDFLPVKCGFCDQHYCSKHGNADAHACPSAPPPSTSTTHITEDMSNVPVSTYTRPARTGPKDIRTESKNTLTDKQLAALEALRKGTCARSDKTSTQPMKKPRISPQAELRILKMNAEGTSSIAADSRLYLRVQWEAKTIQVFINKVCLANPMSL
ncbi:hypothetical protein BX661DRAFT_184155 [Kickxella alabastrina]|uniref:uncharacterized protein n=1 Tax=Kickxella alabastrina TaxID=61397 RepID=UPI00221ED37F|nr:uncharacterized protein BX661DRAFT_184155 [Kickxella alabastrina]KAI7825781.1 hypothetical protein BX661DRAFT_184155 [Kickxella alabastrina]